MKTRIEMVALMTDAVKVVTAVNVVSAVTAMTAATAVFVVLVGVVVMPRNAQAAPAAALQPVTPQDEADYRVIAARCGSPAFEKAFMKQSIAAVAAGLVTGKRTPAETEKAITGLRRSPFVLVAASADCPEQLARLAQIQKSRSAVIKPGRAR